MVGRRLIIVFKAMKLSYIHYLSTFVKYFFVLPLTAIILIYVSLIT